MVYNMKLDGGHFAPIRRRAWVIIKKQKESLQLYSATMMREFLMMFISLAAHQDLKLYNIDIILHVCVLVVIRRLIYELRLIYEKHFLV